MDINYAIASKEEKTGFFLEYGDLLNSFESSVMVKITVNNHKIDLHKFKEDILIPFKEDGLDEYRKEYNEMLLDKLKESDDFEIKYLKIIDANGAEQALSVTELQPSVKGVVVVCEGGDNKEVQEKVRDAVKTALNITSKRVFVTK